MSGRMAVLGIPVSFSTAMTRSGGTRDHAETACLEMPMAAAIGPRPPAALTMSFMLACSLMGGIWAHIGGWVKRQFKVDAIKERFMMGL